MFVVFNEEYLVLRELHFIYTKNKTLNEKAFDGRFLPYL